VGVERSEEGSLRWWCKFNALVSAREGRRRDKALPEDEVEAVSSMERKCDMVRRCDSVGWRRGDTEERKGRRRHQLG
jgi:hypothetical protein